MPRNTYDDKFTLVQLVVCSFQSKFLRPYVAPIPHELSGNLPLSEDFAAHLKIE